jgi:signal transduction histidine kinase
MKRWYVAMIVGLMFAGFSTVAFANTPDAAKAMVKKAVVFLKANGKDKALAEFSNPKGQFVKGELYLTVWDLSGTQIAHGANAALVGKNLIDLKDSDGKAFVKEFMAVGKKGSGWVDYKWTNPKSKKIEPKTVYLEVSGDVLIGCGVYK